MTARAFVWLCVQRGMLLCMVCSASSAGAQANAELPAEAATQSDPKEGSARPPVGLPAFGPGAGLVPGVGLVSVGTVSLMQRTAAEQAPSFGERSMLAGDHPGAEAQHGLTRIVYHLERIDVRGNRTRPSVITSYVPLRPGDQFDPNDPALALARFRLMGTGFFSDVRLSLERGSRRGWVILVIEVEERNTLVIERVVAGLSRVVQRSSDINDPPRPYAGLGIAERNLLGLGIGVSAAAVASLDVGTGSLLQYGADLRYEDWDFLGGRYDFSGRLFHNHAREFFGRNIVVFDDDKCLSGMTTDMAGEPPPCDPDLEGLRSVVIYDRTGLGLGIADDITPHLRYTLDWLGERVDVLSRPTGAVTQRGRSPLDFEPIDFRIEDGTSVVSSVLLGLIFDTRDHPAIPSRGTRLQLHLRLSSGILGSDYDFSRPELTHEGYIPLPWGHVLELGVFAGMVFGHAPFFYHFYAADLSDLLPSRQLELNLDHRRPPNLLGTSIGEMDAEEVAARIHAEYKLPVRRSSGPVRGVNAYFRVGMFMLARREDLKTAIPGYHGFSRIPIDLSFDVGVVADTDYGLFKVGFSSFVGFLPDLGRADP